MDGCGAAAQVPIHFSSFRWVSALEVDCEELSTDFASGFCAITGMDNSPMSVQVMALVISLLMGLAPQKYLAGTNLFRRLMALRASILGPGPRYNASSFLWGDPFGACYRYDQVMGNPEVGKSEKSLPVLTWKERVNQERA